MTFISANCENLSGYQPAEFYEDERLMELAVLPDDRDSWSGLLHDHQGNGQRNAEYRIVKRDGTVCWVNDSLIVSVDGDGRLERIDGVISNITIRKKAETDLDRMRNMLDQGQDAIYMIDAKNGQIIENNQTACSMLQYSQEELFTKTVFDIDKNIPDDWLNDSGGICVPDGQSLYSGCHIRKDGTMFPVEIKAITKKFDDKQYLLAVVRDISERVNAENALTESEERYRLIFENTYIGIAQIDLKGNLFNTNNAFCDIFGYSIDEIQQLNIIKIIHPDEIEKSKQYLEDALKGKLNSFSDEMRYVTKDGSIVWLYYNVFLIRNAAAEPKHFIGIAEDVTERKQIQQETLNTSKLESLSLFADGISHDFNNMLNSIGLNVSLAKLSLGFKKNAEKILTDVEDAVQNASVLTKQLQTYAKGGSLFKAPTSIKKLLRETVNFALRGSNVTCDYTIPDDIWSANIDSGQISQVIQNLVINAVQAMPDGGNIEVSTENVEVDESQLSRVLAGKYVIIKVKDYGTGIEPSNLNKIFDPYYSTKKGGNGLGLSTSYAVINNHEGHISVESVIGQGTIFSLTLPATFQPIDGEKAEVNRHFISVEPSGKILIMDDEDTLSFVMRRALELKGFTVETASDGDEAFKKYMHSYFDDSAFDYVILDLVIPGGMGGKETLDKMLRVDPDVKAILMSGNVNDPVLQQHNHSGFLEILPKPFKVEKLLELLNEMVQVGETEQKS